MQSRSQQLDFTLLEGMHLTPSDIDWLCCRGVLAAFVIVKLAGGQCLEGRWSFEEGRRKEGSALNWTQVRPWIWRSELSDIPGRHKFAYPVHVDNLLVDWATRLSKNDRS